jgi:hypothetical protein
MLRGVLLITLATWLASSALAETPADRSVSLNWAAVIIRENRQETPGPIRVQDPYCDYGVGPCGGTCNEEGGKHWNCLSTELPCYRRGHCSCEAASICKPPGR